MKTEVFVYGKSHFQSKKGKDIYILHLMLKEADRPSEGYAVRQCFTSERTYKAVHCDELATGFYGKAENADIYTFYLPKEVK